MNVDANTAKQNKHLVNQEYAVRNERFVEQCLKQINTAGDAEEGLRRLLQYFGEVLECERVYVFEEMDRQHIRNTYEWCRAGTPSGIRQLPYVSNRPVSLVRTAHGRREYYRAGCGETSVQQRLREARCAAKKLKETGVPENRGTVLLVDDSPELLRLNERILRPEGYKVFSSGSLQQAREILAAARPDAVVLDIDLPDGSGIDFCKELRGSIPVVFLTARSDEQAAREGLQAGGCAFLTKPYQLEELQKAVIKAVKSAQLRVQS